MNTALPPTRPSSAPRSPAGGVLGSEGPAQPASSLGGGLHSPGPLSPHSAHSSAPAWPSMAPTATQLDVAWEAASAGEPERGHPGLQGRGARAGKGSRGHRARQGLGGPRCGEGQESRVYLTLLAVCIQPTEIHATGAKRYPSSWCPWGRWHSDARNLGHTPACTIPAASTTPAQPTSSRSQRGPLSGYLANSSYSMDAN